ncbi:MAG TPA: hypothetical protein DIT65_04045 [Cryomorphaceae bacterium]|nr:hypothetical protein [Cryomorphaceae bacterium]
MNAKQLKEFFEQPEKMDDAALVALKQAVQDFPYAAPLQVLYMKALQNSDNYQLPVQVKRSAIAVPDRTLLKGFYETSGAPIKTPVIDFDLDTFKAQKKTEKKRVTKAQPKAVEEKGSTEEKPVPKAETKSPPRQVPNPVSKPVVPKRDPDSLDHLPEGVRNAILRSRALTKSESAPVKKRTSDATAVKTEEERKSKAPVTEESKAPSKNQDKSAKKAASEGKNPAEKETVSVKGSPSEVKEAAVQPDEDIRIMPFSEKASFLEWLNADMSVQVTTIDYQQDFADVDVVQDQGDSEEQGNQIRKIIQELPKFEVEPSNGKINVFTLQADAEGKFVTETLAEIYFGQRLFDKAIKAYEILSLKYPEKSGFFADRIREIKKQKK